MGLEVGYLLPLIPHVNGVVQWPWSICAEDPRAGAGAGTGRTFGRSVGGYGGGGSWGRRSTFEGSWRINFFSGQNLSSHVYFIQTAITCEVCLGERKEFIHEKDRFLY